MALHSSPVRSAAAATALASIGAFFPGLARAADDPPGDGGGAIRVVDHGNAADRVLLAAPVTHGSAADATTTINMNMAMDASGLDFVIVSASRLTPSIEVRSVDPGGYTAGETITEFEQSLTDAGGEPLHDNFVANFDGTLVSDFSPLVGVPLLVEYNNQQAIVDAAAADGVAATPEQHTLIASLIEGGPVSGTVPMNFPDIPLGEVTGTVTILGTLRGSVSNGLDREVTADLLMDGTFVQDTWSLDIDMTMGVEYVSTPRG